mgnify:FL=1
MHVGTLIGDGADEETAAELAEMQAERDPFAAGLPPSWAGCCWRPTTPTKNDRPAL